MNVEEIKRKFRTPAEDRYPELREYSRQRIYEGKMGPGGLYLAAQMARRLELRPGELVLDLGCGRGASSVFLAETYDVSVTAVDLWIGLDELKERIGRHGAGIRVTPLNLDITGALPFVREQFDAIFCMDCVHYFGDSVEFWNHLLRHLKPGGRLCIGSPCFDSEFSPEALESLPHVYDDGTALWPAEFSRYHSPLWWKALIEQTGTMDVFECAELEDGIVYWEDDVLDNLERGRSGTEAAQAKIAGVAETDAAQITFRRQGVPYLTHFVLGVRKRHAR